MRSIMAWLVLGLGLGMLLANAWLSPDPVSAQPTPSGPTGGEMAQAAEVAKKVREFERLIARAEAARLAGNCEERGRILLNAQQVSGQLTEMKIIGYPISREGLDHVYQLGAQANASACPPRTLPGARQEFQLALTEAVQHRGRGCETPAFSEISRRAFRIIRQVQQDLPGRYPPELLESWRTQLNAELELCEVGTTRICPSTLPSSVPPGPLQWFRCRCPPGPYRGRVFGSCYYSADSDLCSAARHAGAIPENGAMILAHVRQGRAYYVGKTRNGITSRRGNLHDRTITFDGLTDPVEERLARWPICRHLFSVYSPGERQAGITCRCMAGALGFDGTPYGSGPYTGDSSICGAARHAGVLTSDDDLVTATLAPGLDDYPSSYRNGVASRRWGTYPFSMNVEAGPR